MPEQLPAPAALGARLELLAKLVEDYEKIRFPFEKPDPIDAIVFRMEQQGLRQKDIANLLLAAEIIVKSDPSFRLEIAGDGPLREELVRLCHERKLGQIVKFLGEVRDIPALLERASLFVLPSRSEGISLTLLEAMARGLPVVATQVGGNPEVVISGQTGLLVPSRDPAALAGAVLQMRSNFDDALLMGRAGRRRVEDHFDIRAMIARYERLYLDLRSRHRTTENRERGMVSG